MIRDRLERIRERAYALWERAGGGHGEHETHWRQASDEIDGEDAPKPVKKSVKAPAKPAAGASKPKAAPKTKTPVAAPSAKAATAKPKAATGKSAKPAKSSPAGGTKTR